MPVSSRPATSTREPTLAAFLELVDGRRGHFRLESGHHSPLWLDLDALFAQHWAMAPFVTRLAVHLRKHTPEVVCGPLLGGAFLAQLLAHSLEVEFCFTERQVPVQADGLYRTRYQLPPAYGPRVRGRRVAMVDDVMSAGSALRSTYLELQAYGAVPVVAGALLVLGDLAADFFAEQHVPVETVVRDAYELWEPSECPLCVAGRPLEDVTLPAARKQPDRRS